MTQISPTTNWDTPGSVALPALDVILNAVRSNWSGPIDPANPLEGQIWSDNSMTNYLLIKQYYSGSWIPLYRVYSDRVEQVFGFASTLQTNQGTSDKLFISPLELKKYVANLKTPYDIPFNAGFDDNVADKLEVKTYGSILIGRDITIKNIIAKISSASTGANVVYDFTKNNTTIFTTKPRFTAGGTVHVPGVLKSNIVLETGSILKFKVTQIGSSLAGSGINISIVGET